LPHPVIATKLITIKAATATTFSEMRNGQALPGVDRTIKEKFRMGRSD
jgi:hypothetical protein